MTPVILLLRYTDAEPDSEQISRSSKIGMLKSRAWLIHVGEMLWSNSLLRYLATAISAHWGNFVFGLYKHIGILVMLQSVPGQQFSRRSEPWGEYT